MANDSEPWLPIKAYRPSLQGLLREFPAAKFEVLDNRLSDLEPTFLHQSLPKAWDLDLLERYGDVEGDLLVNC
jgi:hypothetical protein